MFFHSVKQKIKKRWPYRHFIYSKGNLLEFSGDRYNIIDDCINLEYLLLLKL